MLAVAFVGQGIDALRSPKPAADAARPALEGLQKLPDPVGSSVPKNAETFAKVTAAVQIIGGALLATGRVPRVASAALAATVIPANLGARMFWNEMDPERKAAKRREFLTDISLLGGLIIASADTAGKPSLGWRGRQAAARLTDELLLDGREARDVVAALQDDAMISTSARPNSRSVLGTTSPPSWACRARSSPPLRWPSATRASRWATSPRAA